MPKKALNKIQITTLSLAVLLILSCFVGPNFAGSQTTNFSSQSTGSASIIEALINSVNAHGGWNSSLQTIYDGITLGQTTVTQLQNAVDSINITSTSAAETVFYWYLQLNKLGVSINETTIETALDKVTMLPDVGGLLFDYSNSGIASFLVYNRYDLYAYEWAHQLGFEIAKWNLSLAYSVFNNSVAAYGKPVLCVGSNQVGWGIGYGPRYYDETAETIDMYLTFWLLGIDDGLTQAEYWWNWENANLWVNSDNSSGGYYKYAINWTTFECEAGGFDQIVWKLHYFDPSITNVTNLLTDVETRALSQGWDSPQWADYVVVHATENSQQRLENTIMSWGAMLGLYSNMNSTMQSQVQAFLDGSAGSAPAWNLTLQSKLYDNSTGMFRIHSDGSDSTEATADGAVLLMMLSTVPVTGSLAVPLGDCVYQDINNVIDGDISHINLTNKTVTISVAVPGTFLSMFGTNIFEYTLDSPGVWQIIFDGDWNSITSKTLISELPSSRIYLGMVNSTELNPTPTPTLTASPTPTSSPSPTPSPTPTSTPSPTPTLDPIINQIPRIPTPPISYTEPSPTPKLISTTTPTSTITTTPTQPTTPTATSAPTHNPVAFPSTTIALATILVVTILAVSAYIKKRIK